jgi:predicted ATPase
MRKYAQENQLWVVSHAASLVEVLADDDLINHIELDKDLGETYAHDQDIFDAPAWKWPTR